MKSGLQKVKDKEIIFKGIKKIIFFGDPGCTGFTSECRSVVARILKAKADLFFILGDIVHRGKPKEFKAFNSFCKKRTNSPIFTLCGNHDLPGYCQVLGSSTYSIISDDFVFIILDNACGPINAKNVAFLKEQLNKHKNKAVFLLFHVPPPNNLYAKCMNRKEWADFKKIIGRYKHRIKCLFTAHAHALKDYFLDGYRVIISGGGGARLVPPDKSEIKSHHALSLTIKNKGDFRIKVIPLPDV